MKNPCWAGYKAYGFKMLNGKRVPNCVPIAEEMECDDCGQLEEAYDDCPFPELVAHEKLRSLKQFMDILESAPAWQRKAGKNPEGGLNKKGIASYRSEHPGSKLSLAVTTAPSKLKAGSKAAKRRKSFCARMKGMKHKLTSSKTAHDPNSRINKSLRKWNCN